MTKHEREIDITNSNAYLNGIIEELLLKYENMPQINVLGFSQGAATMSRWICQSNLKPTKVVFWGGAPAHDLETSLMLERLNSSQVIYNQIFIPKWKTAFPMLVLPILKN